MDEGLRKARRFYDMDQNESTRANLKAQLRRIYGFTARADILFPEIMNVLNKRCDEIRFLPAGVEMSNSAAYPNKFMESLQKYPYTSFATDCILDSDGEDEIKDISNLYGWKASMDNKFTRFDPDVTDFNKSLNHGKIGVSDYAIKDFGIDLLGPIADSIYVFPIHDETKPRIDELGEFNVQVYLMKNSQQELVYVIAIMVRDDQEIITSGGFYKFAAHSRYFNIDYSYLVQNPPVDLNALAQNLNIMLGKVTDTGDGRVDYNKLYLPLYTSSDYYHPYGFSSANFVPWENGFQIIFTFKPDLYLWMDLFSRSF